MSDQSCYVFLADVVDQNQVWTVYCTVEGFSREQARVHVAEVLNTRKTANSSYRLLYLGIIDYHELDEDIVARQDQLFEKQDSVWIQNGSYSQTQS